MNKLTSTTDFKPEPVDMRIHILMTYKVVQSSRHVLEDNLVESMVTRVHGGGAPGGDRLPEDLRDYLRGAMEEDGKVEGGDCWIKSIHFGFLPNKTSRDLIRKLISDNNLAVEFHANCSGRSEGHSDCLDGAPKHKCAYALHGEAPALLELFKGIFESGPPA